MGSAGHRRLGLVALACGLITACASPAPIGLPTAQNTPGTCKTITTAEEMVTPSDVSPAVPCSEPHVYEVYAWARVPASIAGLSMRPGPELLQSQLANVCPYAPIRPYLGAGDLDSQWGISVWPKAPTRAEWSDHLRVVVCNLVVDNVQHEVPLTMGALRGIMGYADSARVRQCRTGTALTNTTCNRPHRGERAGSASVPAGLSRAAASVAADQGCTARVREYTGKAAVPGYQVGHTEPANGTAECWLTSTHGDVTGTLRAGLVAR